MLQQQRQQETTEHSKQARRCKRGYNAELFSNHCKLSNCKSSNVTFGYLSNLSVNKNNNNPNKRDCCNWFHKLNSLDFEKIVTLTKQELEEEGHKYQRQQQEEQKQQEKRTTTKMLSIRERQVINETKLRQDYQIINERITTKNRGEMQFNHGDSSWLADDTNKWEKDCNISSSFSKNSKHFETRAAHDESHRQVHRRRQLNLFSLYKPLTSYSFYILLCIIISLFISARIQSTYAIELKSGVEPGK